MGGEGGLNSELTRQEARFVIDELSYLNTSLMLVLSGGEPMIREDIFDIVECASQAGFITVMGSNGTLITMENLRMLKHAGLKGLGVSIDSVSSQHHDSFRGLEGAWEMSVSALRSAKEVGIETQMDVTLTDKNVGEFSDFIDFGASLSVKAVNFFFLVCTGRAMKTDITGYNYEAVLKKIAEVSKTENRLMVRARCAPHIYRLLYEDGQNIPQGTRGCLAGRHYMRIDPEGNVTPCPYMPVAVGNVKEMSLSSIWGNSPFLKLLRKGNYRGRCGICEYSELCGGCRARALMEKNDFMEEDSLCEYKPSNKDRVVLGDSFQSELLWDEKAKERVKKIPPFMRGMITRIIEAKAKEKGIGLITSELIDELKKQDYSGMHRNYKG
jgi:radical SAM protein with 4Fe4S-binding SPASM domain